jgi:hypothetical protein
MSYALSIARQIGSNAGCQRSVDPADLPRNVERHGSVKLDRVAVDPIRRFLNGSKTFPILGTDPRNPDMWQVFSAAPIRAGQNSVGYAYVVP